MRLPEGLTSEVVERHIFGGYTEIVAHFHYGGVHHRRAAEVELYVFGSIVLAEALYASARSGNVTDVAPALEIS